MQKLQESETRDRFNMLQKRPIPASIIFSTWIREDVLRSLCTAKCFIYYNATYAMYLHVPSYI